MAPGPFLINMSALTRVLDNPVVKYFRESKVELEKVSWPTRKETIFYSTVVVAISLVTAALTGALDFGLSALVEALLKLTGNV